MCLFSPSKGNNGPISRKKRQVFPGFCQLENCFLQINMLGEGFFLQTNHMNVRLQMFFSEPSPEITLSPGRVPIGSCDSSLENWTCGDISEGAAPLVAPVVGYENAMPYPHLERSSSLAFGQ